MSQSPVKCVPYSVQGEALFCFFIGVLAETIDNRDMKQLNQRNKSWPSKNT